jgi:glycerol uptake operon antiterminator
MGIQVIPSVKKLSYLEEALKKEGEYILISRPHIGNLKQLTEQCHAAGKKVMVNTEMVGGLGNDKMAYQMLEKMYQVDAVIERSVTKINMMKNLEIKRIWRVTLIDSFSVETVLSSIENVPCHGLDLRPSIYALKYMDLFLEKFQGKIIIGGFIENKELIEYAEKKGVYAVTTSMPSLWR